MVQGAQNNGMTAGMNSGAFSGAAGLPESFDQYRPPVQVRACARARPARHVCAAGVCSGLLLTPPLPAPRSFR